MDRTVVMENLRNIAASLIAIADTLAEKKEVPEVQVPKEKLQEEIVQLKLEDVRAVLADIARKGKTALIRELLQKYGADKLSAVDPGKYSDLLKEAKELENA